MIPCRLFLQKCVVLPEHQNIKKLKIVLTLNSIFYDEIHPFQTKYFCLSSHDAIGVEVSTQDHDLLIGSSVLNLPFRLALESEQIEMKFKAPFPQDKKFSQVYLVFALQPVSQFTKKKLGASANRESGMKTQQIYNHYGKQLENNQLEISFSHRDPLLETSRNLPSQILGNNTINNSARNTLFPLNKTLTQIKQSSTFKLEESSSESLQNLAHQRERLLGELFGKLRRDNKKNINQ